MLTSISIFSNLVECVDFSDLSGATEGWFIRFFRINNIELKIFACPVPKISQVMMKWRRRASDHGRFTLWHNGLQAALLGRFKLWHNDSRATQLGRFNLLCVANSRRATQLGRFTLWHNGRRQLNSLFQAPR